MCPPERVERRGVELERVGGRGEPARPPSWAAGGEDWRAHLNRDVGYLRGPAWGGWGPEGVGGVKWPS